VAHFRGPREINESVAVTMKADQQRVVRTPASGSIFIYVQAVYAQPRSTGAGGKVYPQTNSPEEGPDCRREWFPNSSASRLRLEPDRQGDPGNRGYTGISPTRHDI